VSKRPHIFRDSLHGFVELNDLERDLVDSSAFQRLRHIHQLALTYYVYHGAEHTRFGHSIGVMEVVTKIFDVLVGKHRDALKWNSDQTRRNRQLIRLAALLHDVGHAPFSHAGEDLITNERTHEDISAQAILETDIAEIIRSYAVETDDISPDEVAGIIQGTATSPGAFLREILAGDLDADRIDYLNRDSIMAGVRYGLFDYERLIHTLTLYEDPMTGSMKLAVEDGGVHALEGLILARYFMFTQVYFNKVRVSYDQLLNEYLQKTLTDGHYPDDVKEYLGWDDLRVMTLIREDAAKSSTIGHPIASRIWNRQHYKLVAETAELADTHEIRRWDRMIVPGIHQDFGQDSVTEARPEKSPHKFGESDLRILDRVDGRYYPVEEISALSESIPKINQRRLYAKSNNQVDDIKNLAESIRSANPLRRR
jgi:uncharacterized protein